MSTKLDAATADKTEAKPPVHKKSMIWYASLLVVCTLIWGAWATAVKYAEKQLGPIALAFLPFYVTTILLIPLLIWRRRANPQAARPTGGDWYKFVIAGVFGQILAQLGGVWGVTLSTASNSAILMLLVPVITAVLASMMLRERITPLRIVCLLLGLAGVMIMSLNDLQNMSLLKAGYLVGNLLLLGSCIGSAFYNVYCKGLLARFAEVEILIFSYITASVVSIPVLWWVEPDCLVRLQQMDWRGWGGVVFLAILHYGVSMLLLFYVLQHLPVTVAASSIYLCSVFGVLIPYLVLNEKMNKWQWIGSLAVLIPTVIIMKYDSEPT